MEEKKEEKKGDEPIAESTLVGETGLGFLRRDKGAMQEEDQGILKFEIFTNDGTREFLKALIDLKNIVAKQLPKMPKEYIVRLIMDRHHKSMMILKRTTNPPSVKVIGGIVFRPFSKQKFAEIAFLAITSLEQVKGYGTRLMNKLKAYAQEVDIQYFLTYADNNAIGYFRKQGFSNSPRMPPSKWRGYIKDYDGGTLMECYINSSIDFNHIYTDVKKQKETLMEAIKKAYLLKKRKGFELAKFETLSTKKKKIESGSAISTTIQNLKVDYYKIPFDEVQGVKEAGWTLEEYKKSILDHANTSFYKQCENILNLLTNDTNSWPFRIPVNSNEVRDYYDIIKEPMDLATMRKKLESKTIYLNKTIFTEDILRIFNNARIYNKPNTIFYRYATDLEKLVMPYLEKLRDPTSIELQSYHEDVQRNKDILNTKDDNDHLQESSKTNNKNSSLSYSKQNKLGELKHKDKKKHKNKR